MNHIKNINEVIKNKKTIKWFLNKFLFEINNKLSNKIIKNDIKIETYSPVYYKLLLLHTSEKDHQTWMKSLDTLKRRLFREDIIVSYKDYKKSEQELIGDGFEMRSTGKTLYDYIIYLKNIHTNRINPNRYVYHFSDEKYRSEILKNGLKKKSHTGSKDWEGEIYLEYPEAVFAVNSDVDIWKDGDKWQIDTSKIKNTWWEDLNFKNRPDLIMTFSDIPKEAIKLQQE